MSKKGHDQLESLVNTQRQVVNELCASIGIPKDQCLVKQPVACFKEGCEANTTKEQSKSNGKWRWFKRVRDNGK